MSKIYEIVVGAVIPVVDVVVNLKMFIEGLFFRYVPPPLAKFFRAKPKQAGKKERGLGEGIFARLLSAPKARQGWEAARLCSSREAKPAKFSFSFNGRAQNSFSIKETIFAGFVRRQATSRWGGLLPFRAEILVQNRFVLRSAIATKCNFYQFWGKMIARSPRLRLGSLRKFPYILRLNQMDEQNQKLFFYPAGDGSACEARNKIEFHFQFFLFRLWRNMKPVFKI